VRRHAPPPKATRRGTRGHRCRSYKSCCNVLLALVLLLSAASARAACTGDCDRNHAVSIAELLRGVGVSLGSANPETCEPFDANGDGHVAIDELIAGVGFALGGCPAETRAFVTTTTFEEGSYASVVLDEPRAVTPSTPQRRIFRDAVARSFDDLIYVVNRLYADNIQVLDPADNFHTRLQCSTGNGTNPHDIAVVSRHKAYVTLFEKRELLIVNPSAQRDCSDFVLGHIDLSSLADADGVPDMDQMAVVGDRLYVSLQRLDINTVLRLPAGNGAIAVIDLATDQLVGSIELSGPNPFAATKGLTVRDGALWISEAGEFNVFDGGIERVDLATGTAGGFRATETELGGDITDFAIVSDHRAYAIVSRPGFVNALVSFDPTTGQLLATHHTSSGYTLFDIELNDRGELYLSDRGRRTPGLRVFRAADGAPLLDGVLDLGLPPFEILFY
jgi:DNA-binding beta-propeller fold protein YncE